MDLDTEHYLTPGVPVRDDPAPREEALPFPMPTPLEASLAASAGFPAIPLPAGPSTFYGRRSTDGGGGGGGAGARSRARWTALSRHLISGALGGLLVAVAVGVLLRAEISVPRQGAPAMPPPAPPTVTAPALAPVEAAPVAHRAVPVPRAERMPALDLRSEETSAQTQPSALEELAPLVPESADPAPAADAEPAADPVRIDNISVGAWGQAAPVADAPEGAPSVLPEILSHKAEIEQCVNQQRAEDPDASGRLVMQWEIQPDGSTANITSEPAELEDSALATCMVAEIRGWTFAPTAGERPPVLFPVSF